MKEIKNAESIIKKQISEILQNVGYSARKIILFGSRARKDFTYSSDYDILIITETTFEIKEKMSLSKMIREYLAKSGIDVDILIKSDAEVQVLRDKPGSIVRNAMREGFTL
ncbi:Nucleotidyltransferase domain protein [uncultured archaeon]|nr:Nucleotidyltransferase domain protein [uncultured archaeon]